MFAARVRSFMAVACAALAVASQARAEGPQRPAVVVAPVASKGGPKLDAQLKLLEGPMKSQATIVPYKAYQKAAKKLKVKPKDAVTPAAAVDIGKELKLTHVVLVEGATEKIGEGKKAKAVSQARVSVLSMATGEKVFTQTYVLKGKKLTADVAAQIASELMPKLVPEPAPATPAPVAESTAAQPPPPPPPLAPELPTPGADATPVASEAAMPPPAAEPAPAPAPGPDPTPAPVVAVLEPPPADVSLAAPPPPPGKAASWRPGLVLHVGALGFWRNGKVADGTATPVEYSSGGSAVPMPAAKATLEVYPLAFGGDGAWYEGLGLDGAVSYTQVVTEVTATPKKNVTSPVMSGRGGLSLRFVLWNAENALDVRVRGGYGLMKFPLKEGAFPGMTFAGPYAGLTLTYPVISSLAIVLGGTYTPTLAVSGRATELGTSSSGSAFGAEGGLRVSFGTVQVGIMGQLDQYTVKYKGASTLAGPPTYTGAKFTDQYAGVALTAGLAL